MQLCDSFIFVGVFLWSIKQLCLVLEMFGLFLCHIFMLSSTYFLLQVDNLSSKNTVKTQKTLEWKSLTIRNVYCQLKYASNNITNCQYCKCNIYLTHFWLIFPLCIPLQHQKIRCQKTWFSDILRKIKIGRLVGNALIILVVPFRIVKTIFIWWCICVFICFFL